jgi:hypothetical protein
MRRNRPPVVTAVRSDDSGIVKAPTDRPAQADSALSGHAPDDVAARLAALPDNHPSSPGYASDAKAIRAPEENVAGFSGSGESLDRPKTPPLDDGEFKAHVDDVAAGLETAKERGLETKSLYTVDPDRKVWDFGRVEEQNEIIDHLYREKAEAPCDATQ